MPTATYSSTTPYPGQDIVDGLASIRENFEAIRTASGFVFTGISLTGADVSLIAQGAVIQQIGSRDLALTANAYAQSGAWTRLDTTRNAWNVLVSESTDTFNVRRAAAGSNPVSTWSTLLQLSNTGDLAVAGGLKEYGRATAAGVWTNFASTITRGTTTSGATWTGGTVTTAQYMLIGHTMFVTVVISNATITGAPAALTIDIPGGFTSTATVSLPASVNDNNVGRTGSVRTNTATNTKLELYPLPVLGSGWTNTTGGNSVHFQIAFPVN